MKILDQSKRWFKSYGRGQFEVMRKVALKVTSITRVIMVIGVHSYVYLESEFHNESKYLTFRHLSLIMQM